ncbi:MAG: hypothetical protein JXA10_05595 [Anaerolineae bacterium]|nr:hypothetical protein [Anaerolineae bacterium]
MVEDLFKRAMAAFQAGRKDEARSLFMDVVEQSGQHEQAWLYLSALVDSMEEQQICLENVLTINPNNAKAQQGLNTLRQKLSGQQETPPPAPEPDPWTSFAETPSTTPDTDAGSLSGASFGEQDDNLFGASAFDTQADAAAFGSGFDFNATETPDTAQAADDPFSWLNDVPDQPATPASPAAATPADSGDFDAFASSVDWGSDDQPATYGSGRQVDEPTSADYDNWMDSLPLGADADDEDDAGAVSAFGATPFGDTSFMVEDDSYADEDMFGQQTADAQSDDSFWDAPYDAGAAPAEDSFTTFGAQTTDFGASPTESSASANDDLFDSAGGFADDEPETSSFGSSMFDDLEDENGSAYFDEPEPASSGGSFNFSFDDGDGGVDDLLEARLNAVVGGASAAPQSAAQPSPAQPTKAKPTKAKTGKSQAVPTPPSVDYYRLIPADIEPLAGGISQRTMMLVGGIGVMVVLNLISLVLLVV